MSTLDEARWLAQHQIEQEARMLPAASSGTPEYQRGYYAASKVSPKLTVVELAGERDRKGTSHFHDGWRDYFRQLNQ